MQTTDVYMYNIIGGDISRNNTVYHTLSFIFNRSLAAKWFDYALSDIYSAIIQDTSQIERLVCKKQT